MPSRFQIIDEPDGVGADGLSNRHRRNHPWKIRRLAAFIDDWARNSEAGSGDFSSACCAFEEVADDVFEPGGILAGITLLDNRDSKIVFSKQAQVSFRPSDIAGQNHDSAPLQIARV